MIPHIEEKVIFVLIDYLLSLKSIRSLTDKKI